MRYEHEFETAMQCLKECLETADPKITQKALVLLYYYLEDWYNIKPNEQLKELYYRIGYMETEYRRKLEKQD